MTAASLALLEATSLISSSTFNFAAGAGSWFFVVFSPPFKLGNSAFMRREGRVCVSCLRVLSLIFAGIGSVLYRVFCCCVFLPPGACVFGLVYWWCVRVTPVAWVCFVPVSRGGVIMVCRRFFVCGFGWAFYLATVCFLGAGPVLFVPSAVLSSSVFRWFGLGRFSIPPLKGGSPPNACTALFTGRSFVVVLRSGYFKDSARVGGPPSKWMCSAPSKGSSFVISGVGSLHLTCASFVFFA